MNISGRPISQKEPAKKLKTCKVCKKKFVPSKPLQTVCDFGCAIELNLINKAKKQAQDAKKERKEYKDAKEKQKSRRDWLGEAQQVFNSYIRARDKDQPCISCRRHHQGQYHAGHYRTTKAAPELRFNEKNVHKQCSMCNLRLSGNLIEYRKALIELGIDVDWLEGPHEPKHYSIDDLKVIKAEYKLKLKALEKK